MAWGERLADLGARCKPTKAVGITHPLITIDARGNAVAHNEFRQLRLQHLKGRKGEGRQY
jgi:hypothetical protein